MAIKLFDKPETLTYNKNEVVAEFIFSDEWDGNKTAIFDVNDKSYPMLIDENNQCSIPEECYFGDNRKFRVGVICGDMRTTTEATVQVDKSCYEPNTTVPEPTPDVYSQLNTKVDNLDKKVDQIEVGNVDLSCYFTKEQIAYMFGLSEFFTHVNGTATTWIPGIQGFSVTELNKRINIPAIFADLVNDDNTNEEDYYMTIISAGVKLADDISDKCKRITFSGSLKMLEGLYSNTECRVIACAPNCPESMYIGETYDFDPDLCLELGTYGPPMGGKRSGDFTPRPFATRVRSKSTGEVINRNGWIFKFQMMTDSWQEIIVNSSFILMTFWNRNSSEILKEV